MNKNIEFLRQHKDVQKSIRLFDNQMSKKLEQPPFEIKMVPMKALNINDDIFDSLKQRYPGFEKWWDAKCKEGRTANACFKENGSLAAILILKLENDLINTVPILPAKDRLKICTLKVIEEGLHIGGFLINKAIESAIAQKADEIYFTHFETSNDRLIELVKQYDFNECGFFESGESLYIKKLK